MRRPSLGDRESHLLLYNRRFCRRGAKTDATNRPTCHPLVIRLVYTEFHGQGKHRECEGISNVIRNYVYADQPVAFPFRRRHQYQRWKIFNRSERVFLTLRGI
jgi:hypothetical protein